MTRTYTNEIEAKKAIRTYFSNRAAAQGKKSAPKIKVGEMDCDGEFFFQNFQTAIGTARLTFVSSSTVQVHTEY